MQLVFFRLHLILHARIERSDVMATVALFGILGLELNAGSYWVGEEEKLKKVKMPPILHYSPLALHSCLPSVGALLGCLL